MDTGYVHDIIGHIRNEKDSMMQKILANIRNNFDAASAENVLNQVNNNDNHNMANDPQ